MIRSGRRILAFSLAALFAACTPVGLWVYDDPRFEVSRVRVNSDITIDEPVVLGLAIWNPNLYELSTARIELRLRLDDLLIGDFMRDSILPLPQGGMLDFALPLRVPTGPLRERIRGMQTGTHRFAVEGKAVLSTPFGLHDVPFAHEGDMDFGGKDSSTAAADSGGLPDPQSSTGSHRPNLARP